MDESGTLFGCSLLSVTLITSFCADWREFCNHQNYRDRKPDINDMRNTVVASIEETAKQYHIPKPFIGLILLPLVVSGRHLFRSRPDIAVVLRLRTGKRSRACHKCLDGDEK